MHFKNFLLTTVFSTLLIINACKDKTEDPKPNNSTNCDSKNITVNVSIDSASKCSSNGKLAINVSGSTGFTYQLGTGSFQADSIFSDLAAGAYSITVKDFEGCTKTVNVTLPSSGVYGAKFTIVNNIITTKCNQICHTAGVGGATKGIFNTDCDIVSRKALIKTKAVDGTMGSLNSTEKQQITDWINAGGQITN
ncbi:MAG: hypothetical protein IT245_07880 [Bacteroidia bacterium]|nr:hypothetical protein [Bacteroidia bacterium]